MVVCKGDRLMKCETKDFFMCGRHPEIANDASELIKPNHRIAVNNLIACILRSRLISSKEFPRQFWKMMAGCGILISSGDVSDNASMSMVELPFVCINQIHWDDICLARCGCADSATTLLSKACGTIQSPFKLN